MTKHRSMNWASMALNAIAALAFVAVAVASQAQADEQASPNVAVSVDANGIAANGYDVVAFFTEGKALEGDPAITAQHRDATYLFSAEKTREMFLTEPSAFTPQFGGFDAYGVRVGRKLVVSTPPEWQVTDEKLLLFIDKGTKALWNEAPDANYDVAREIWTKIQSLPDSMLASPLEWVTN